MSSLIVEFRAKGKWHPVDPPLGPGEAGSVSHNGPAGRQLYVFQCEGDHSIMRRSSVGIDREDGVLREITSAGFEDVAEIIPGVPYECFLKTDRMREPMRFRFRHED